ncbi:MAG: sigma-54-dependent Fis family transcriptional regulator [Bacillota bacterium]
MEINLVDRRKAWEQYMRDGQVKDNIDQFILSSWNRSQQFGVDPFGVKEIGLLTNYEIKGRINQNEELIQAAVPEMTKLYQYVKQEEAILFLVDTEGFIVKTMGRSDILKETSRVKLVEGANWGEQYRGTNAIGTALAEKKTLKVHASEHYAEPIHFLSCFAAPIFGPTGRMLAVLDVTVFSQEASSYVLGMVMAAAGAIENRLFYQKCLDKLVISYQQAYNNAQLSKGMVGLDSEGKVALLNSAAGKILGRNTEDCVGVKFEDLLENSDDFDLQQLLSRGNWKGRNSDRPPQWDLMPTQRSKGGVLLTAEGQGREAPVAFAGILGESNKIKQAINAAIRASRTDSTVLLIGETGTGKELFARAIHQQTSTGAFVAVNCGAIPRDLVESELFGYEEGAFTGARKGGSAGKFEQANGGTIFLDEIVEMPASAQVALLRVLQEKEVVRVGGQSPVRLSLRVIAASNKDLKKEMMAGRFRDDLYYRLNVISIEIPPLKERGEDIIYLTRYFIEETCKRWNRPAVALAEETGDLMLKYEWPGNVRELKSIIERALNLAEDDVFLPRHLPAEIRFQNKEFKHFGRETLRETEFERIKLAVQECRGNISEAARILGISRNTVYRKLRGLEEVYN